MWNILECPVLSISERGGEVVVGGRWVVVVVGQPD